jgi:hemerythrin superfamily protein
MATTTSDSVIDTLHSQHAQVKALLTKVGSGGDGVADAFCELRRMVAVHETAEEQIVYPALRATGAEATRVVEARMTEEAEGVEVLTELEGLEVGSAEFAKLFETFHHAVLDHASAEEREVFPLLASTQTPERLREMARGFDTAEAAAPAHTHPHTGSGGDHGAPAAATALRVTAALQQH